MKLPQKSDMLYGFHPVLEALQAKAEIERIYIQNGLHNEKIGELTKLAKSLSIPFNYVPIQKLNKFTRKNHQGLVAFTSAISYGSLENAVDSAFSAGRNPLILILDRITDVRNVGATARSADAFGVDALLLPAKGGALLSADAVKASAGALNHLTVCRERFLDDTLKYLKNCGLQIVACTEKAEKQLKEINFAQPTAIIMGSEEDGVSASYLQQADEHVMIPMQGHIGSLNVSVSAGIVLYEVRR